MSEINLGEKRLDHATTKGAPMVIRDMDRVPIRSMSAGDAPVKGVSGCCERVSKTAWKIPKAKLIPQHVKTIVNEARVMMIVCLMRELGAHFQHRGRGCRNRNRIDKLTIKKHTGSNFWWRRVLRAVLLLLLLLLMPHACCVESKRCHLERNGHETRPNQPPSLSRSTTYSRFIKEILMRVYLYTRLEIKQICVSAE